MKIIYHLSRGEYVMTSPTFKSPEPLILESFWDEEIGGDTDIGEEFFNADLTSTDDDIEVRWFEDPQDPQATLDLISAHFGFKVPDFSTWVRSV